MRAEAFLIFESQVKFKRASNTIRFCVFVSTCSLFILDAKGVY